jgi:hypothetical protein
VSRDTGLPGEHQTRRARTGPQRTRRRVGPPAELVGDPQHPLPGRRRHSGPAVERVRDDRDRHPGRPRDVGDRGTARGRPRTVCGWWYHNYLVCRPM